MRRIHSDLVGPARCYGVPTPSSLPKPLPASTTFAGTNRCYQQTALVNSKASLPPKKYEKKNQKKRLAAFPQHESMASLFVASGVRYAFSTFCLTALLLSQPVCRQCTVACLTGFASIAPTLGCACYCTSGEYEKRLADGFVRSVFGYSEGRHPVRAPSEGILVMAHVRARGEGTFAGNWKPARPGGLEAWRLETGG